MSTEDSVGQALGVSGASAFCSGLYQVSMIETHPQGEGPAAPGWRTPASPAKGSPQRDLVLVEGLATSRAILVEPLASSIGDREAGGFSHPLLNRALVDQRI